MSGAEIVRILQALRPRVGSTISAAVIPSAFRMSGSELAALVRENCREIALHGFAHAGGPCYHPLAWLTRNSAEFLGLPAAGIRERLNRGQDILRDVFGSPASVLIPPAWCLGALTPAIAESAGCRVVAGLTCLVANGARVPLAVYSWDCGRYRVLGYAGEWLGRVRHRRRGAIPCVVLHPGDVPRRFLDRGLAVIDHLLSEGLAPATFAEIGAAFPDSPKSTR